MRSLENTFAATKRSLTLSEYLVRCWSQAQDESHQRLDAVVAVILIFV